MGCLPPALTPVAAAAHHPLPRVGGRLGPAPSIAGQLWVAAAEGLAWGDPRSGGTGV